MNKAALFLAGGSPQGQMVERHYRLSPIRLYGAGANAINQISEIIGRPQASRRLQLDKEPAIMVREPDATRQPTPHDIQLMSKHRVPSFKPQIRLEWRGRDGQNETEQPDHSASLGDSITSSTRIRFSVHIGGRR
jgi:hypothetical protein